jgi:hypothetical protein
MGGWHFDSLPAYPTPNGQEAAQGCAHVAGNIATIAQAANGVTKGAKNRQGAAGELARMAIVLQRPVGHFRFDESARNAATSAFRFKDTPGHDYHLASRFDSQAAPTSFRVK